MKVAIDVRPHEADPVRLAMADAGTRATVTIIGALMQLPSDRARRRVLDHVQAWMEEQEAPEPPANSAPGGSH
jgi:hypothetical protein